MIFSISHDCVTVTLAYVTPLLLPKIKKEKKKTQDKIKKNKKKKKIIIQILKYLK